MNFLLRLLGEHIHGNANVALFSVAISFLMSIVIAVAFYVSKKFTDSEFRKLKNVKDAFFDRAIIVGFSSLLSTVIMVITILLMKLALASFTDTELLFSDSYCRLMIAFSLTLAIFYALIAPENNLPRPFNFSAKDAHMLFRKLSRIVGVSLAFIIIERAISLLLSARSAYIFDHLFGVIVGIYYFMEIYAAHSLIAKFLYVAPSEAKSLSVKLVLFINRKFPLILFMGMLSVIAVNYLSFNSEITFLENMKELCCILIAMLATQMVISAIINFVLKKFETMFKEDSAIRSVSSRQKNLIWVCDVLVLFTYLFLICVALQYFGINVREHIFKDKTMIVALVVFVTIVMFKSFNEFTSTLLEKAENSSDKTRMKIETFVPILSVAFNVVLFGTATLIGLSNLGVEIAPILTTFTVFSAAIGFAAKDILQSFLQGVILLFERDLYIGEEIKVNGLCGIVEKLSARVMYLRDVSGSLHIIPYNMINTITNKSKDYVNCIYELPISSETNVDEISKIIRNVVDELRHKDGFADAILEDPIVFGLKPFDLTGMTLTWSVLMKPGIHSKIFKFEVYTRLKKEFEKRNIEIPISNTVVSLS